MSPVAAVCRPPRLAGRQRTTGGLSDSNDSDSVSRAAEEQVLHCYSGLRVNFAKFSFQKYSWQRPAVTRRGPSLNHLQRPAVTRRGPSHSGLRSPCYSPRPDSLAAAAARRHSHRQLRSPRPESLAAAHRHSQLLAVHHSPRRGPTRLTRRSQSHSPRTVVTRRAGDLPSSRSLVARRQCPSRQSLATARRHSPQPASIMILADSVTESVTDLVTRLHSLTQSR